MDGSSVLHLRLGPGAPAEAAGAAVQSTAMHLGVSAPRATRIRVMVEELVAESFAREDVEGECDVVVDGHFDGTALRVLVTDLRLPVSASEARSLRSRRLAGLGFVDRLKVHSEGKAGNIAECEVVVHTDTPEHGLDGSEPLPSEAPVLSDEDAAQVEVRRMEPSDAFGLIRCLYRCYGYTYKEAAMYQRRSVEHMLRTGSMTSVVAVLPDGEVVGHSAYVFEKPGDRVPEAGRLIVDPRLRGHHLAESMARVRSEIAAANGVPGLWAECVANHPASQKMVLAAGGAEVGLLIGASPADVKMSGLDNEHAGRRTLVATYTPAAPTPPSTIYVRPRHAELFTTLAERLGLERTVVELDSPPAPTGHSRLHVTLDPGAGTAHIRILRCGADLVEQVADEVEALLDHELGAVWVDVPLWGTDGAWAAEQLERLQFCWAAWVPGFAKEGDVLRLQRVSEGAVDTDHLVYARPEGQELHDQVLEEWHRVRRAGLGAPEG